MFGGSLTVPVPDVDRTDFLLMLGANPFASNGSLATAPDWPGRIEALLDRGGRLVVVDPRRTQTAEAGDEHLAIRPGTDASCSWRWSTCWPPTGWSTRPPSSPMSPGSTRSSGWPSRSRPEAVAPATGLDAEEIRRWPTTWRPRRRPASTDASAPPPPSSAR